MKRENCYYLDYGNCTNKLSRFQGKTCPGAEPCGHFVSESAYFTGSVDGTLKEGRTPEEIREAKARVQQIFTPEKSRKQIKREEKLEAAKNRPANGGFSLGDDPRFKDLFGKKDQ